tara:strand:+ start:108 stop:335 length:228 start_codon:yes stop_codon:yes gene_type:complete
MKAFFISVFFMNADLTLSEHFIGRLPSCAYANSIVKTFMKNHKDKQESYAGYLCMASKHYWDEEPKLKLKQKEKK